MRATPYLLVCAFALACTSPEPGDPTSSSPAEVGDAESAETAEVAASEEAAIPEEDDPFDVRSTTRKIEEFGIPTPAVVAELESHARELVEAGFCEDAIQALDDYAKQANWLSNVIAAGLEPYYDASYDDRKEIGFSKVRPLIKYEEMTNDYRTKRNRAMVMKAECLAATGRREQAVAEFIAALRLIEVDDHEWWRRARHGLYELIDLEPKPESSDAASEG